MVRACTLLLVLLGLASFAGQARAAGDGYTKVHLTKEQALTHVFPDADRVLELRHILSGDEIRRIEKLSRNTLEAGGFYIYAAEHGGEVIGYAVVVAQVGKTKPITHIVGVTPEGETARAAVMVYRESIGDEVADARFMAQYAGKTLDDAVRIDRDIINVAGATLSGHAICRGVRQALATVDAVLLERDPVARRTLLATAIDVTPPALRAPAVPEHTAAPESDAKADDSQASRSSDDGVLRLQRSVMGTVCTLEIREHPGRFDAERLLRAAEAALDEVGHWDDVLSDWNPDTPLSRLNTAAAGTLVTLDPDLAAWLDHARAMHTVTNGAFDPAVGALVSAWGLRSRAPSRPDAETLTRARDASGLARVLVSADGRVSRSHHDLRLDPGGSGKGWALDRAAEVLADHGVERALLSFRSTLLALGPPADAPSWPIPIVHDGDGSLAARVELTRGALSVSAGGFSTFDDGGTERGHVLDPATGVPVEAARLAWVRHPSAATADALSTALLVSGTGLAAPPGASGAWLGRADGLPQLWAPRALADGR